MADVTPQEPIWTPTPEVLANAEITALCREVGVDDYEDLWRWSVQDVGRFWATLWKRFDIQADGDPTRVLASAEMPGAEWFPDVALSFPEHIFRNGADGDVAIRYASELHDLRAWTWGELRAETARIRAGLKALGVGRGDRVVGYLPHIPHTIAAFLAVSSLGAIWSCCSPDFGARTVVDRFAQIEPKVLLAVDGYRYGGKDFDRSDVVEELRAALPTVERIVRLGHLDEAGGDWHEVFAETDEPLAFERVPFSHPLWVVYSSGTTGLPKAIVHGHGGPLLEMLKQWRLGNDAKPGDRITWFTTTGWIMWNILVGALLVDDVSILLYDGNPGHPDLNRMWDLVDEAGVDIFGTSAAFIHGCMKAGLTLRTDERPLTRLRAIGSTGSPLSPEGFLWLRDQLGEHTWVNSISGGTDIASAFVGGVPIKPVYAGELPARLLGIDVDSWDEDGNPVHDDVGELVVKQPMPSMPVYFWGDEGDVRYTEAYFEMFPGVWRHGDWIRITPRGSSIIYGRSDSTINRGGIRMGTAEIYAAVMGVDGIENALVVDVPPTDGTGDSWLGLFVVLADGAELTDDMIGELRTRIRKDASPRHVPNEVIVVPDVPRTLTGKLLEVPVKKLLMGRDPETSANKDALANPEAYAWFVDFAKQRTPA